MDAAEPAEPVREDVERLCAHLANRIVGNGSKRPEIKKVWRDAARLLMDKDGRTEAQIHAAIDWCQDDEFWRSNILSMPKLREKYDQLRLSAQQRGRNGRVADANGRKLSTRDGRVRQALDAGKRLQALIDANGRKEIGP